MHAAILASKYALHIVGRVRRLADTLAPDSSLAAYQFCCLGSPYGTAPLAVSCDGTGELARTQRRSRAEQGGFLLYYLDKLVYPDISPATLTTAAVLICALNLAFYGWQARIARLRWQLHNAGSHNSIDCGVECGDAKNGSTSRLDKAGLDVSLGCRARSTTITSDGAFFVNQRRAGLFWRFHHS